MSQLFCDVCRTEVFADDQHLADKLILCKHCAGALLEFGYLQRVGIDYVALPDATEYQQKRKDGRSLRQTGRGRGGG